MRKPNRNVHALACNALTIALPAIAFTFVTIAGVSAGTEKTLHSFCNENNCGDGETPRNGLVMDAAGNLYGTTEFGGKYNEGLVYKLIPNAGHTKYTEHILKSFCAKPGCTDGAYPDSELIMDMDGNIYGTTEVGGKHGGGEVFRMKPVTNGWTFAVIHSFCAHPPGCSDGDTPYGGLAYAGQTTGAPWNETSSLFGTTSLGGGPDKGTVYSLTPGVSGWSYQVLHVFNPSGNPDSVYPGPLVVDASGDVVGVTYYGAANGAGALYRLASGSWTEDTLHNFCADASCSDGANGLGRLAIDANGNIFGVTLAGGSGSHCPESNGCGVAFERTASGHYKVIYDFCSKTNCKDGLEPSAGLTMDASGNLYGVTHIGGKGNLGVVFLLGSGGGWPESVLYAFCSQTNCTDGAGPAAPVIMDDTGNVYGTTAEDGANGSGGTAYRLAP